MTIHLDGLRTDRIYLDASTFTRLADCPYCDVVVQRIVRERIDVFLSVDVLMEIHRTKRLAIPKGIEEVAV